MIISIIVGDVTTRTLHTKSDPLFTAKRYKKTSSSSTQIEETKYGRLCQNCNNVISRYVQNHV